MERKNKNNKKVCRKCTVGMLRVQRIKGMALKWMPQGMCTMCMWLISKTCWPFWNLNGEKNGKASSSADSRYFLWKAIHPYCPETFSYWVSITLPTKKKKKRKKKDNLSRRLRAKTKTSRHEMPRPPDWKVLRRMRCDLHLAGQGEGCFSRSDYWPLPASACGIFYGEGAHATQLHNAQG